MQQRKKAPKQVEITLRKRVSGGAIRYVLADLRVVALALAAMWVVVMLGAALSELGAVPVWLWLLPAPLPLVALHERGVDVFVESDTIVVWRSAGIRYWSHSVPLMVPTLTSQTADLYAATDDNVGTRRVSNLYFDAVVLKDVNRKRLGQFMAELRWLVHERQA